MATLPTIEVVGPAGRRIINETDKDFWQKKGYNPIDENAKSADSVQAEDALSVGDMYDLFESHKVADLKRFAKLANIDGSDQMNKAELVKTLVESGYQPIDGDE